MDNKSLTLERYFDANFTTLQEEIALFVKGFPIINMNEISSLNTLVGLLIKQNSMLGSRLRDQVVQIKQNYKRSQQTMTDFRKKYAQIQSQVKEKDNQCQQYIKKQRESQYLIDQLKRQIISLKTQAKQSSKHNPQTTQQIESNFKNLISKMYSFCNQLIETKFTKSESLKTKLLDINSFSVQLYQLISNKNQSHTTNFKQNIQKQWQLLSNLWDQKIKYQKSKSKVDKQKAQGVQNIIDQIQQIINQFSHKSKQTMRILKLANHNMDTSRVFMDGFDGQIQNMVKRIQDVKQGMPEATGRRSIDTSILTQNKKQRHSFQAALIKTVEALEKGNSKKDHYNQINKTQQDLHKSLKQIQKKCKQQLESFSKYFNNGRNQLFQQIKAKDQINNFYQRSIVESRQKYEQSLKKSQQIQNNNLQLNRMIVEKTSRMMQLEQKNFDMKKQIEDLEKKIIDFEKQKYYLQQKYEQSVINIASPIKQELLRVKQQYQEQKQRFLLEKEELLESINTQKKKIQQLMMNLVENKQDKVRLTQKIVLQGQQTIELSKMLSLKDKQIDSLGDLIRQLQTKVRCQAIDLRGKEFQLQDNDKKIKQLVDQNHDNMNHLKQIRSQLPIVIQLKNNLATSQQQLLIMSEQNLKLKMLIKQTKIELINSRKIIAQLSEMSSQFQDMKNSSSIYQQQLSNCKNRVLQLQTIYQKTKDSKQKLQKRVQELQRYQIETLTLQAENNRLLIEIRHMKNVLARIQQIKQFV